MRGFLVVGTLCRVSSSTITLFCVCITIINKFGKIYKSNSSIIRTDNLFDPDIIWWPGSLYFIYIWLYSFLLFQHSMVLHNQLISHACMCADFLDVCLVSFALIITIEFLVVVHMLMRNGAKFMTWVFSFPVVCLWVSTG